MTKRIGIDRRHVPEKGMMSLNQHLKERKRGRLHSSAAKFTPTDIATLEAWHKVDTLSLNHNDPVASWSDSSGNGLTLAQSTTSKKPTYKTDHQLNGYDALYFDGGDDLFTDSFPSTSNYNFFMIVVAEIINYSGNKYLISFNDSSGQTNAHKHLAVRMFVDTDGSVSTNKITIYRNDGSNQHNRSMQLGTDLGHSYPAIMCMGIEYRSGNITDLYVWFNGSGGHIAYISRDDVDLTTYTLGSKGNGSNGIFQDYMYEAAVFNTMISTSDRQKMEGYLSAKYNIPLPSNHIYFAGAP